MHVHARHGRQMTDAISRSRLARRSVAGAASTAVFLMVQGCYVYLPQRDPAALRGQHANISLTDSGSVILAPKIGAGIVDLEGVFEGDSAGGRVLAVYASRQRSGVESDWRGERLVIPEPLIASIQKREFSATRTAFVSALGTAGLVVLTRALRGTGEGGQGANPAGGRPAQ
jgi:hypothetical protein